MDGVKVVEGDLVEVCNRNNLERDNGPLRFERSNVSKYSNVAAFTWASVQLIKWPPQLVLAMAVITFNPLLNGYCAGSIVHHV
jgi:hypothetical protein